MPLLLFFTFCFIGRAWDFITDVLGFRSVNSGLRVEELGRQVWALPAQDKGGGG